MLMTETISLVRCTTNSWIRTAVNTCPWWYRIAPSTRSSTWVWVRWHHFSVLKMVSWYPITPRMLLGSCSSRIEEVIDALEGSTALSRNFSIFSQGILQLNIWKSGEHLIARYTGTDSISSRSTTSRSWPLSRSESYATMSTTSICTSI